MQIRKGLWAILFVFFILFQHCSKIDRPAAPVLAAQSSIISLEQAQNWASVNISTQASARSSSDGFIGVPAWKRTRQIQVTARPGILKVALEKYALKFGYRDLLFQQQADGNIHSIVQQVLADSAYLVAKVAAGLPSGHGIRYYLQNDDFTGDVIYLNPATNQFLYGWRYQNGQAKFRLKPQASQSQARAGGGPIDNDDVPDEEGGGPGWTGTGNNTDGYTIDGPEIVAPGNNNPPPYIPPTPGPDPVTPPVPVGGGSGNQSGGGGGPKDDPKADDNYENDQLEPEAIPCPLSFNFVKTGDWQSAVIKNYYFEYLDKAITGRYITVNIGAIEVGMPRITYKGDLIQPDIAQRMSAQAAAIAEQQTLLVVQAWLLVNPRASQQDIDNNPAFKTAFKEDYREALNQFLRADYGYINNASPASVSTSQAQFVLKDPALWLALKFYGRDC